MKKFIITEQLAQALLNYLAEMPFKNVANLVNGLLTMEVYEPEPTEEEENGGNTKGR